jgi:hypothetical protein
VAAGYGRPNRLINPDVGEARGLIARRGVVQYLGL